MQLRRSAADRYSALAMTTAVALVVVMLTGASVFLAGQSRGSAIFLGVMAAASMAGFLLIAREMAARWRTRVAIDGRSLNLRLPAQRSMTRQSSVDDDIDLAALTAVESRQEAFRGAGNTVVQHAFSLVLSDGRRILLGADRQFLAPFYEQAARAIASSAGLTVRDLGMVDGHAGRLMLWGQSVPGWSAAPLSPALADRRTQQQSRAWRITGIIIAIAMLVRLLVMLR